jgi:hypothetical protein
MRGLEHPLALSVRQGRCGDQHISVSIDPRRRGLNGLGPIVRMAPAGAIKTAPRRCRAVWREERPNEHECCPNAPSCGC